MRTLIAWIFSPLAVLLCGKPLQAILNFFLWCLLFAPGIIHALAVIRWHEHEMNTNRIVAAASGRPVKRHWTKYL